ncbi:endonuclease/exonuclease/phosphatase family protein [Micromonospora nigra]|uniref:endonuclease/exonuclease/phosphatase family protein n=1 Tax=Micromonospora nigra TaxID=145857 RepID=UPI000B81B405
MRHRHSGTLALALGVVVLVDVLRVFLPSVITIFGQAAATPAELLGVFALGWFVLAFAAPPLVARIGARPVTVVAGAALAGARLALTAAPGGRWQLWLAAAGLLAGLVWLAGSAARTARPVPGLALGLAAGALLHTALATHDLVWRGGWLAWTASAALVAAFVAGLPGPRPQPDPRPQPGTGPGSGPTVTGPGCGPTLSGPLSGPTVTGSGSGPTVAGAGRGAGGARAWMVAGPALLLAGMLALSPAVAGTAMSYLQGRAGTGGTPLFALAPMAPAVAVFVGGALTPVRGRWRPVPPAVLLAGTLLATYGPPRLLVVAMVLAAAGLGGCLALLDEPADGRQARPEAGRRRAYAALVGMLGFAVATVLHYAAYDLGYPNGWLPPVVAALVAVAALRTPPTAGRVRVLPRLAVTAVTVLVALVATVGHGPWMVIDNRPGPPRQVRLVAYNIRMGFGLDGRLDLDALARAAGRADVVVLSEVDRGWLLNGGHDTLHLLAVRLGMPYVFAPAAGPLWGDAVLSRWPVRAPRTRALPAVGAPTGAQALAVTVDFSAGVRLAVVGTHLQPPPDGGPVAQARAVAAFATGYAAGMPLVVAGDLNTEPDDPAYAEFIRAGLVDALAAARPLPTSPADDPREQIDHVLVSPDLGATDAGTIPGTASDHLPVAVTLALPAR